MLSKTELREKYIKMRREISNKAEKSSKICKKLAELDEYKNAQTVAFYKALPSEVNLDELISDAFSAGKTVLLPKTLIGFSLKFYRISENERLFKSPFGVYEPQGVTENEAEKIDFIILPGVCFDLKMSRIGFGKGCYDRTLKELKCPSAAVCFEEQILKGGFIPYDENDVKPDILVTDERIYRKDF